MKIFRRKIIILLAFFIPISNGLLAQNKGSVTGIVKDAQENIPFASVFLLDKSTNAIVKQVETDTSGVFQLSGLEDGSFIVKISHVGYEPVIITSVIISSTKNRWKLGLINMQADKHNTLEGITVNSPKSDAQIGFNKKKFSVEQSLVSKGGNALDVLQNTPSVQIDASGNVGLRGSSKVNVLVDGKPSLIGGGNVAQILQSLPASAIESIEVITNPSARYDAEGESGIINIILIKNKKLGFNGSAAVTAGTPDNYNGSAGVSFQNSRVNIYLNDSYRYGTRLSNGFQDITYVKGGAPVMFSHETFPSTTVDKGNNIKGGIDYYITDKTALSVSGSMNTLANNRSEYLSIDELNASHAPVQLSHRSNDISGTGNSYEVNLDFSTGFAKPKEELTFNAGYSHGNNDGIQRYTTDVYNLNGEAVTMPPAILRNNNSEENTFYNIAANYTLPLGKSGALSAGYRGQIRIGTKTQLSADFNNATTDYDKNYAFSNLFNSNNQVHAFYFNYQGEKNNFSYQVGLRAEDAVLSATLSGFDSSGAAYNTPIRVANFRLYPGIFLTQKIAKAQQLQLSYARRVSRPVPRQMNPVPDVSDPVNYDTGNPNLLPEDIHFFELSYSKEWEKITLSSSLYYRLTKDFIKRVEGDPVNGVITTISQNLPYAYSSGLEIIGRFDLFKVWSFTCNANVYHNKTDAAPAYGLLETSGFSWNTNITNNIRIAENLSIQLRGDYRAADVVAQDGNHAAYGIDAGAKFDLLHKRATINFSGRDIFNTRKWGFLRVSNAVLLDFERLTQSSRANLTFTYRFGKSSITTRKIKRVEAPSEISPDNG